MPNTNINSQCHRIPQCGICILRLEFLLQLEIICTALFKQTWGSYRFGFICEEQGDVLLQQGDTNKFSNNETRSFIILSGTYI